MELVRTEVSQADLMVRTAALSKPLEMELTNLGYRFIESRKDGMDSTGNPAVARIYTLGKDGQVFTLRFVPALGVVATLSDVKAKRTMSFTDYLTRKTGTSHVAVAEIRTDDPWDKRAERCLSVIQTLVKTELKEVMQAKVWIDVPVDWSWHGG